MNIKNQQYAKYIENIIPFRDLTSMFLFEDSSDLSLFIRKVREEQNLTVHTALVPKKSLENFVPKISLNDIKKYGFSSYLREQIEAPEAILVYLCLYSQVHQLPVGDANTQKNIKDIMPKIAEIGRFFTSTHLYTSTKSRYTGQISSQSADVPPSFWLTSSVNQDDLTNKEEELTRIKNLLIEIDEKLKHSNEEKVKLEKQLQAFNSELNKLKDRRLYIESVGKNLHIKQTKLKSLESENIDLMTEARKKLARVNEFAKKKVKLFADSIEHTKTLVNLNKDKIGAVYLDAVLQAEKAKIQAAERDYIQKKQDLESNYFIVIL